MKTYQIGNNYKSFVDVSLAFEANALTGDITVLTNERAISNSIQNLILTINGEVPFENDIGSSVISYLFEILDIGTAGILQQEIERVIKYNEPRVQIVSVDVQLIEEQYQFDVTVSYRIVGYQDVFVVTQILESTR